MEEVTDEPLYREGAGHEHRQVAELHPDIRGPGIRTAQVALAEARGCTHRRAGDGELIGVVEFRRWWWRRLGGSTALYGSGPR